MVFARKQYGVCQKTTWCLFGRGLHRQAEVISAQDAAITEFARLAAGCELHEPGTGGDIDGEGDAFLTTDHVTIACCYIPHAPGYALHHLFHLVATLAIGQTAVDEPRALGYATEL